MKLAVKNIHGVQTDNRGKLKYYYLVNYDYDFSGNSRRRQCSNAFF